MHLFISSDAQLDLTNAHTGCRKVAELVTILGQPDFTDGKVVFSNTTAVGSTIAIVFGNYVSALTDGIIHIRVY